MMQRLSLNSGGSRWYRCGLVLLTVFALHAPPRDAQGAEPTLRLLASLGSESDPRVLQLTNLSWSPTGRFLSGWSKVPGFVLLYDIELGKLQEYRASPGQVRTIAWEGERLAALIQRALNAWEVIIWNTATGEAATHTLHEENLPDQCRFMRPRPFDYAWLLLARDGHSFWVGCVGEHRASTYPAAARFDLTRRVWSTIELTPAHPDSRDSFAPQFFEHQGRDLLSLTNVSLDRSKQSKIWLTLVDVGSGDALNIPLQIATPRQQVFCTLPHPNRAALTVAYTSVKEGRPVPRPSYEEGTDYEYLLNTISLDGTDYSSPLLVDPPRGSGCEGFSLFPHKEAVGFVSAQDKGLHFLDIGSGSRVKALPMADAYQLAATRDGKRMAIQQGGRRNNSPFAMIEIYDVD